MRNIWNIALNDLRVFLADRGNIVGLIALPIIMTFVLGFAFSQTDGPSQIVIDVLDEDGSDQSAGLIDDLKAVNSTLLICPLDEDCDMEDTELTLDDSLQRLQDGDTSAVGVIPDGYGTSLSMLEPVTVGYYAMGNTTTGDAVLPSLEAALQPVNGAVTASRTGQQITTILSEKVAAVFSSDEAQSAYAAAVYDNARALWDADQVSINYVETLNESSDEPEGFQAGFGQSVPGMATMFVMFTVFGAMALLLRERQQWTLQRVVVMPVSRTELIGGKILGRFLMGLLQFLIVFAVGLAIGLSFGNDILALLLIMFSYTLAITAIAMVFASFIENEMQANGLSTMLSIILASLGGAWWPLFIVPDFMRIIGHISPVAWAMDGFNDLLFFNGGLVDVLPEVGILLVIAAVAFVLGVRAFKYE